MAKDLFQNGSVWLRADFHLHTQADKEFKYSGDQNLYASNYVAALKKAGIRVGVITNHNKFDHDEFKALRKTAKNEGICLLPGVELSTNEGTNGIHVLLVFSESWLENGKNYIGPFLASMFPGKAQSEYENENGRSDKNLLQVVDELEKTGREYFLVFAHVEARNGLWFELGGGRLQDWREGRYDTLRTRTLGFQKVRSYSKPERPDEPCREKIKNALGNWYPAEIEGCDCKSIDDIGNGQSSFLEIGDFTFEAVKYALLDHENRVSSEPKIAKHSHIQSISFQGGILDRQTIHFSAALNSLIGIRGSGKSSILEAVRYVLDIPYGDKAMDREYKLSLVRHTLGSGGKATIHAVDQFGQVYSVSRIWGEPPNVYLDEKLQQGISIRETILRKPIYFGQKDLSSSGEGFEKDLVEKLLGEKLQPVRSKIEAQKEKVVEAITRLVKLKNTEEQKKEYQAQKQDATIRLEAFKKFGFEGKLQKRVDFNADSAAIKRTGTLVSEFILGLREFISQYEDDLKNAKAYQTKQNTDFFAAYFASYEKVLAVFGQLKRVLTEGQSAQTELQKHAGVFADKLKGLQEEFAEAERKLAEELRQSGKTTIQPDEFIQQQKRLTTATQMLEALGKQQQQKAGANSSLMRALDDLNKLWLEEFTQIRAELERVNANNSALTIEAEFKGDKTSFLGFARQIFRGSNIREGTFRNLMENNADFGAMFRNWTETKANAGSTPEVFEKFFLDALPDLLIYQVPNLFVIKYRGKELKQHSLGQRASALILFVLSQRENDVIIIDQPEDDLDNQTIYDDVIKLIRKMKASTQFVLATHNANFPVLGDAEQIHACAYESERVSLKSGSIDCTVLQQEIIDIMEGGKEAFNRRKEVYSIWTPRNSSK